MTTPTTQLRDLIESNLDEHWLTWSQKHPNLADAIDRTRLIDHAVKQLRQDPAFIKAVRRADRDEHQLDQAEDLLNLAERWVRQVLPG